MVNTKERIFFQWLLTVYVWLLQQAYGLSKFQIGDIKMNYVVKDDNPNVRFTVEVGEVKDAEGNVIAEPQLTVEVESSDTNVLGVSTDEGGRSGEVVFGSPGTAAVTVQVKDQNGNLLASGGDNFTVTTGDPKSITGVTTKFDGLTPIEPIPPGGGGPTEPAAGGGTTEPAAAEGAGTPTEPTAGGAEPTAEPAPEATPATGPGSSADVTPSGTGGVV